MMGWDSTGWHSMTWDGMGWDRLQYTMEESGSEHGKIHSRGQGRRQEQR